MQKYISFLRGVNMTGHNSIKMADLSRLYKDLGFEDILTYIQSGNVIFSAPSGLPIDTIRQKIENSILERFSFTIPAMVRSIKYVGDLFSSNPFLDEDNFDPAKMAVIFLSERASEEQIMKVINVSYPPDKFQIIGAEIFIYCPNGFGRTRLYTNFFEQKMGVTGTARNWKTITAIRNIAFEIL
jgi:uncharacterized protein (DUF1697 family)